MKITISVGYEGSIDACLCLAKEGVTKEYYIETNAWNLIGVFWKTEIGGEQIFTDIEQYCTDDTGKDKRYCGNHYAFAVLNYVFENFDADTRTIV